VSTPNRPSRIEKEYPTRQLNEVRDGYVRVAVPPDVCSDERFDFEPGAELSVTGIIEGDESYLRIEAED